MLSCPLFPAIFAVLLHWPGAQESPLPSKQECKARMVPALADKNKAVIVFFGQSVRQNSAATATMPEIGAFQTQF
jgi:hypothetical protein